MSRSPFEIAAELRRFRACAAYDLRPCERNILDRCRGAYDRWWRDGFEEQMSESDCNTYLQNFAEPLFRVMGEVVEHRRARVLHSDTYDMLSTAAREGLSFFETWDYYNPGTPSASVRDQSTRLVRNFLASGAARAALEALAGASLKNRRATPGFAAAVCAANAMLAISSDDHDRAASYVTVCVGAMIAESGDEKKGTPERENS